MCATSPAIRPHTSQTEPRKNGQEPTPAGVLAIHNAYFEFVPEAEMGSPCARTFGCHELEVGGQYFILLTTSAGMVRYNIYDLVRVVDFRGQTPVLEFLNKGAHICSLVGEKLTEHQVTTAVNAVLAERRQAVHGYVLAPRAASTRARVFWSPTPRAFLPCLRAYLAQ